MGCLCGEQKQDAEETIVTKRRVRDVPFLLFFLAFCGGMVYVAIQAFDQGDPARLYYGLDSYGNVCSRNNDWNDVGTGPDLTQRKKLYFLDPLELRDPWRYQYAKAVCVAECPTAADVCALDALPCLSAAQYRCPYYAVAEDGLAGTLSGVAEPWSTQYWAQLRSTSASCGFTRSDSGLPGSLEAAFGVSGVLPPGATECGIYYQAQSQLPGEGPCYPVWTESYEFMNRCLPKLPAELQSELVQSGLGALTGASLNNNRDRLQRYIGDIGRGLYVILAAGLGVGLVASAAWLLLLRLCAGVLAWLTVVAANVLFAGCTVLCYQKAGMLTTWGSVGAYMSQELGDLGQGADPSEPDRQTWAYVAYAMSGLTGLLLLLSLIMARRIKVAVAVLKVGSSAVARMPTVLLFPIVPFLVTVGFTVYWVVVAAYLYSAGQINPHLRDSSGDAPPTSLTLQDLMNLASAATQAAVNSSSAGTAFTLSAADPPAPSAPTDASCANNPDCYYSIDWNTTQQYLFIFHLFSGLWIYQFLVAFGYVSISGAVAHYYWAGGERSKMPPAPLLRSVRNALTYHLGSIAFGSFIITLLQFVRMIFEWVAARFRKLQEQSGVRYLVCIIRGLLWLLEAILKFINRNAYIMISVKGSSYCTAAARATTLLVANALRVAAVNTVGDFLIWLGKLAVAAGCGAAAMLLANLQMFSDPVAYPDTYLSSPILPVAVSVLAGYTVAHLFFQVYEMAVDTILLCFCEDCESHNGNPRFAPPLLLEAIGVAQEANSRNKVMRPNKLAVADDNRSAFIISKEGTTGATGGGEEWAIRSGMNRV